MDMVRHTPLRQHGYTLVEVLAAFALLAVALTLLLGILSGATRQVRQAGDAGRAALHAQSLLDTLEVTGALRVGSREGEFEGGRYHWTLTVEQWVDPATPAPAMQGAGYGLHELELAVRWGDDDNARLDVRSLRMVRRDASAGGGGP